MMVSNQDPKEITSTMKRNQPRIIAAGLGGAVVVAGLAFGAAAATAQDNEEPTQEEPTTETETPTNDDTDSNSPWPDSDAPWRNGEDRSGRPGFGGRFGEPGFGGPGFGAGMESLAEDLGMTPDELTAAFESGQTLPEIAEEAGIDLDELFAGRHEDALASIEDKVASGELSQEQADRITDRIEGFANSETPWGANGPGFGRSGEGRPGFGGPGFGRGGFGPGADALAETLGMTNDELSAAFESGQTLPEIAEEAGIDLSEVFGNRGTSGGQAPWGEGPPPWAADDAADS